MSPANGRFHPWWRTGIENGATVHEHILAIFDEETGRSSFQQLAPRERDPVAAHQLHECFLLIRPRTRNRVAAGDRILDEQTTNGAVAAVNQPNTGGEFVITVVGIMAYAVAAQGDRPAIFEKNRPLMAAVEVVARNCKAQTAGEMNIDCLAADEVAGDGPHADPPASGTTGTDDADVGTAGRGGRLDRVGYDCPFPDGSILRLDPDFAGRFVFMFSVKRGIGVVFNVIARDLQIADFPSGDANASQSTVTHMA